MTSFSSLTTGDVAVIRVWVEGERKALEWSTEGRTFQISGVRGSEGSFERFFHKGSHPTRRSMSDAEVCKALQGATHLELYLGEKGSGQFFQNTDAAREAARKWCGQG